MTDSDVWCFECEAAFPVPPPTHTAVEPFRFDLQLSQALQPHDTCEAEGKRSVECSYRYGLNLGNESSCPDLDDKSYGRIFDDESCAAWKLKDADSAKMHALMNMVSPAFSTKSSHFNIPFDNLPSHLQEHGTRFLNDTEKHGAEKTMYDYAASCEPCIDDIKDSEPTTLMICNIPCRTSYSELMDVLRSKGFGDCVEFLHLPSRSGQPSSNLGYGFVSFSNGGDAARFATEFEGYRFTTRGSKKVCAVKQANHQGFNGKYRHRMIHC